MVSRIGDRLNFEQSLADGIGSDFLVIQFQIQPDNSMTLLGTFIKDNPEFVPKIGTGWLQDWIENEVPYALLSAVQTQVAAEAVPEAVAAVEEFDIDAVIAAVESQAEPVTDEAIAPDIDVDAVIAAIAAQAVTEPSMPDVVEPAEAVYTAVDALQQGVNALWAEPEAVVVPTVVQPQEGISPIPELIQNDTSSTPQRNQNDSTAIPVLDRDTPLSPTEIHAFAQSLTDGLEPEAERQFAEASGFPIQDVQASIERVAAQLEADAIDLDAVIAAVGQDVVAPIPLVDQVQPTEPTETRSARDEIVDRYRQRIEQGDRTKLTKPERQQLIEHFLEALQPLQSQAEIQALCQAEMALLEEGYAQSSVNSVYLPTYTSAVKAAIESGQLALTAETSYLKAWEKLSGEKGATQTHFALDYLTYDTPTQVKLRGNEAPEPIPTVEMLQAEVEAITPMVAAVPVPTVGPVPDVEAVEAWLSLQEQASRVAEQFSGRQPIQPEFANSQLVDRTLLSPQLQAYLDFKDQHPESLMVQPLGSFYEAFFEDAAVVADVIGATRTTRATTPETAARRVPMAGFPKEDVATLVTRLEAAGYNVLFTDELALAQAPVILAVEAPTVVAPVLETVEALVPDVPTEPQPLAAVVEPLPVAVPEPLAAVVAPVQAEPEVIAPAATVAVVLPLQPTVEQPLPALLVTQQLMEQHDPETVQALRQAPAQSDRYSPSLGEMRSWLSNAKELERDRAYLDRIRTLSDDLLRGSDEVFKPLAERDTAYSRPAFTLSEAARKAMTRDQSLNSAIWKWRQ